MIHNINVQLIKELIYRFMFLYLKKRLMSRIPKVIDVIMT